MLNEAGVSSFEQDTLRKVTGETLRPGGFSLTDRAIEMCSLPPNAAFIDLGCGSGATVQRLIEHYGYRALGIDASELMLLTGKLTRPAAPMLCAFGNRLPFASEIFDAAMVECSISVMADPAAALAELNRVLAADGILILSDVYARNPEGVGILRGLKTPCYLYKAQTREEIMHALEAHHFSILLWEDHSETLKDLTAQLIWSDGLEALYGRPVGKGREVEEGQPNPQQALADARLGYFLLVARKNSKS
jgi:SAM-dependent methyltransferase